MWFQWYIYTCYAYYNNGYSKSKLIKKQVDEINEEVIFQYYALFNYSISEIGNTQIDHVKYMGAKMSKFNLLGCSDNQNIWKFIVPIMLILRKLNSRSI